MVQHWSQILAKCPRCFLDGQAAQVAFPGWMSNAREMYELKKSELAPLKMQKSQVLSLKADECWKYWYNFKMEY
jgi:hypothetical protein